MKDEPFVIILVINFNGKKWLEPCIESLGKTKYGNYKIVMVDNGSSDGSTEFVRENYPHVDVFRIEKNQGFAGGNNCGAEYSMKKYKPEYLLLLNNDTEVIQPEWLGRLIDVAESDPKIGIVGCKLVFPDGKIQHAGGFISPRRITGHIGLNEEDRGQYDYTRDADYVTGACFLINKKVIEKIGLLDEGYKPAYFEETDYCIRARKNGFRIVYVGKAKMVHHTSATTNLEADDRRYLIWEKNRIRFIRRNFPLLWRIPAYARIMIGCFIRKKDGKMGLTMNPAERIKTVSEAFKQAGD